MPFTRIMHKEYDAPYCTLFMFVKLMYRVIFFYKKTGCLIHVARTFDVE